MFFENGKELTAGESPEPVSQDEIGRLLAAASKYGIEYQHNDD